MALQEVLRFDTPTQWLGRTLVREYELRGHKFRVGQPVLMLFPSSNRDALEFEEPPKWAAERAKGCGTSSSPQDDPILPPSLRSLMFGLSSNVTAVAWLRRALAGLFGLRLFPRLTFGKLWLVRSMVPRSVSLLSHPQLRPMAASADEARRDQGPGLPYVYE